GGVEPGNVEMIAQEVAGTGAIGRSGRDRETGLAFAVIVKIAVPGGKAACAPTGLVEARADDTVFFAGADDLMDGFGPVGQRKVASGFDVSTGRPVSLWA